MSVETENPSQIIAVRVTSASADAIADALKPGELTSEFVRAAIQTAVRRRTGTRVEIEANRRGRKRGVR